MLSRTRLVLLASIAVGCVAVPGLARASTRTPLVVSVEFDDGISDQYVARSLLALDHMRGTFYVNSGTLGSNPSFMTWSQVHTLAQDGNEIADHGVIHVGLAHLDTLEQAREVCDDRANLFAHGYRSTDFAYPYGSHTAVTERIARNCGYNSARQVGGLDSPGCCVEAEQMHPPDPYSTRSVVLSSEDTLSSMERYVTSAMPKGGWVQLVFHQICAGCSPYAVPESNLHALLHWLGALQSGDVQIKTVREVIGGPVRSLVPGPPSPPVVSRANLLANPSLETDSLGNQYPDCFEPRQWGDNSDSFTRVSSAVNGSHGERLDIGNFKSGAARLVVTQDLGECSPSITPGHRYVLSTWYQATGPVYLVDYYRTANGIWTEWGASPRFASSAGWRHAIWTTPPAPRSATALSFGLTLGSAGSLTTDDYGLRDAAFRSSSSTPWPTIAIPMLLVFGLVVGGAVLFTHRRRVAAQPPAQAS